MNQPTSIKPAVPLLQTKIRRPLTPPLHVLRPRLLDQLATGLERRLILVSAPAGYGKTALVSRWLESVASDYAWLSLDEHDDDVAGFLLYLVAAIRTVYHDALDALELLFKAPTLLAPSQFADVLVQGLAALPKPLILVFDDYHTIKTPEIHALNARLIEHLPAHVHLVLIARADPPLPLERLRGRQQLDEIRAADLRFSLEETRMLLQQMLGPEATEETAALLEGSTEGWPVGLHLAALSLRNQRDPAAFAHRIAEHGHQSITEYLLAEVLTGLTDEQRNLLLVTSLFDRFCTALVDVILPENAPRLPGDEGVRSIQRANLFVVALDDEGIWFRYHHFFQSLLRAQLSLRFTQAEVSAMHARASAWFAGQGLVDEAVSHALAAGNGAGAARIVEAHVGPALNREDWRQIEHWIGLLPADVSGRPRLLLAQGWLHFLRWQFGAIEAVLQAAEAAIDADPASVRDTVTYLRGEISVLRAAMAYNRGDSRLCVQHSEIALAALRSDMHYTMGLAQFYHIWGLQACGQYEKAVDFAQRGLDALGWQPHGLTLRLLLALATVHFEMANLRAMQDVTTIWLKLAAASGLGLSIAWSLFGQGWLHYQRNELAEAAATFRRIADMAWSAHGRAVFDAYTGLVLTALARGLPDEALTHVQALNRHLLERGMISLTVVTQSLRQRVALACGREPELDDWRQKTELMPDSDNLWESPLLAYARTLLAIGTPDALAQAAVVLTNCQAKAQARNSNRRLIEIGALQALLFSAQGQEAAALAALRAAVERAAPGGALRLIADNGPELIGLLDKLQAAGVEQRYIQKLLAAFGGAETPTTTPGPTLLPARDAVKSSLLTNRELEILTLLAARLPDKEIADQLVLSPLTVKKHTQRIFRKLGVHNRRAAVAQARRLNVI